MSKNHLKTGYVMVSRALLVNVYEEHPMAAGDGEAFLRILTYVNFKDCVETRYGIPLFCARGESVISYAGWADILGWSRGRTRGFFERCFIEGTIVHVPDRCVSHIRIPNYDGWIGSRREGKEGGKLADEALQRFIEKYHEITLMPKTNVGRVRREWKKLSLNERKLATENIEIYYYHLPNIRHCVQAASYLADKAFLDEYDD